MATKRATKTAKTTKATPKRDVRPAASTPAPSPTLRRDRIAAQHEVARKLRRAGRDPSAPLELARDLEREERAQ